MCRIIGFHVIEPLEVGRTVIISPASTEATSISTITEITKLPLTLIQQPLTATTLKMTIENVITNTKITSMATEFVLSTRKTKMSELFIYIIFIIIIKKTVIMFSSLSVLTCIS